jgi:bifunctional non-homologous end joining protein LigD
VPAARKTPARLAEYRRKRDFARSPEPRGGATPAEAAGAFVIQKHDATRLHYDFRLELDGVLKSWAVPKGPSLDPAARHLAVQVEDHPREYAGFEGVIPADQYGGGTVLVWDRGTWTPRGDAHAMLARGRLKFELHGDKLRGGWTLVQMHGAAGEDGKNWLLIKERDEFARPNDAYDVCAARPESVVSGRGLEQVAADRDAVWNSAKPESPTPAAPRKPARRRPTRSTSATKDAPAPAEIAELPGARQASLPAHWTPQLAMPVEATPAGDEWLHEVKYDGYRMLARLERGHVRLISRNDKDWTTRFQPVADAVAALPLESALLDGELVALNAAGRSDFQTLQNALQNGARVPLVYTVFDLPYCAGYDLSRTPLHARKTLLERILADARDSLRYSAHLVGRGAEVFRQACALGVEGIVSKRADSFYEQRRTRTWVKHKCLRRQEFVIGGWTDPGGARAALGALLLGYYADRELHFCGRVGTGFDDATLRQLHATLRPLAQRDPPFAQAPTGAAARGVHWVAPKLVAEVSFTEWTSDGILRHPVFHGLRSDKAPRDVRREQPEPAPPAAASPPTMARSTPPSTAKRSPRRTATTGKSTTAAVARRLPHASDAVASPSPRRSAAAENATIAGVRLTHPDRVLYPEQGLTKRDLAEYAVAIADELLPHVVGRPLSVVRCPHGRQAQCFFQKHVAELKRFAIAGIDVSPDSAGDAYIAIRDLPGLVTLVQFGVLELHPWGARGDKLDRPDRLVFDLDPGPRVAWPAVLATARRVHEILVGVGLQSFVKTTGGKGLHVVAPLDRRTTWDTLHAFTERLAESMAASWPGEYVTNQSKAKRTGRILLDFRRNTRGATAVAAYSPRAREGATVATPLRWDELTPQLAPADFNLATVPARVRTGPPAWPGFLDLRQALGAGAMKKL